MFNLISKPHLVDLLRYFDHQVVLHPRIRYASVRSKPELIADLRHFFAVQKLDRRVHLHARRCFRCPEISYDLDGRQWELDGCPRDLVRRCNKVRPCFSVQHRETVVRFLPVATRG